MYLIEKSIQESIDETYIKKIHSDMLIFLKNIKRIKTAEQYRLFCLEWNKWIDGYFSTKLGKNLIGLDTVNVNTSLNSEYHEFKDYARYALYPSELDITKAIKRGDISWGNIPKKDYYSILTSELESPGGENYSEWERAFTIFSAVRDSKYVILKKKIDDFFADLYSYVESLDNNVSERFIEDTITIEGVPVKIEYSEVNKSVKNNISTEYDFIMKAVGDVKQAFKFIKAANFSKAIQNTKFKLSTVDMRASMVNNNGADFSVGGFYIYGEGTTLLKGRLLTYAPMSTITAIIHESGHKFYFENMHNDQRKEWENFYGLLRVNSSPSHQRINRDLFEFLNTQYEIFSKELQKGKQVSERFKTIPSYVNYIWKILSDSYDELITMAKNNNRNLLDALKSIGKEVDKNTNVQPLVKINIVNDSLIDVLNVLTTRDLKRIQAKSLVTEYGSTSPAEFFAEAFTAYCLRNTDFGRKEYKLIQSVFETFIDITRVRSASHESQRKNGNNRI